MHCANNILRHVTICKGLWLWLNRCLALFSNFWILILIICAVFITDIQADDKGVTKILILNSYHKEFPWTDNQTSAAKKVLEEGTEHLELYVEYMDTKRIYNEEHLNLFYQAIRLKYSRVKLDGIITTDDNALRFVLRHYKELFDGIPVSFSGINDFHDALLKGRKEFTGLIEVLDIKATIDLALELHPKTRKVFVVVDNTPTGIGQRRVVADFARQYKNLEFEYFKGEDLSTAELREKLQRLPKDSIVLLTVWLRDKDEVFLSAEEGGAIISAASNAPVYGIIDMYFRHGIVGGKLLASRVHGNAAAKLMLRILDGEIPSGIPVQKHSINQYMFDYEQLARWGISIADLPKGSIVVNKPFSFYKEYKKLIWGISAFLIFQAIVIITLVLNIVQRRKAEEELIKYRDHLEDRVKERTEELEIAKTRAESADRIKSMFIATMSHELRTPLNSIIGFSGITLQGMSGELNEKQRDHISRVFKSGQHLLELVNDVIDISKIEAGKAEASSELFMLKVIIDEAVDSIQEKLKKKRLSLETDVDTNLQIFTDRRKLLQCIINLLSNAEKFTEKGGISIKALEKDNDIEISVTDTGIGILESDQEKIFQPFERLESHLKITAGGTGLGLYLIKKIATEILGGNIFVESKDGKGSTFRLKIPKDIGFAKTTTNL